MTERLPELPDDPFPDSLFDQLPPEPPEWDDLPLPEDEPSPFVPDAPIPEPAQPSPPPDLQNPDWQWNDAALLGIVRETETGTAYEIGCIDLYTQPESGEVAGQYLPIAHFPDQAVAETFYHNLQTDIQDEAIAVYELPELAEARVAALQQSPALWQPATDTEYAAYTHQRLLVGYELETADDPPEGALEVLQQTALELSGEGREQPTYSAGIEEGAASQALSAIGIQAEGFDPAKEPPPFFDEQTGTAYWIGVFQPDEHDPDHCVTSILSLGRNPETGTMEAQLAPCVPGDWDKAYRAAEYLIDIAQKGGIEPCFDAAEGMALATDQRERWEGERGLKLETGVAQDIADYARDTWEVEL